MIREPTYMTKVMMATLDNVTNPLFRPKPTMVKDSKAPNIEMERSCFRPMRFILVRNRVKNEPDCTCLDQYNGWECHQGIDDSNPQ